MTSKRRMSLADKLVPSRLSALEQAAYVLRCLEKGEDDGQITDRFAGDAQLVEIWKNFVLHNHWMEKGEFGRCVVTEKGKEWLARYRICE